MGVPDAVAEKVAARILRDVLCRVQLRRVGRKWREHDVVWHDETRRAVPTSTVEDQQGDGPDADALADFGQMFVHGLDADCWHDQPGAGAARRADGAEQLALRRPFHQATLDGTFGRLRRGKPPVALDPRTPAALGPRAWPRCGSAWCAGQPGRNEPKVPKREALWNGEWRVHPETRFRPAGKLWRDCGARQPGEVLWNGPPLIPALWVRRKLNWRGRS
jgi:hypothetical protein